MNDAQLCTVEQAKPCPWCGTQPTNEPWHGGGPEKHLVGCENEDCVVSPCVTGETLHEALDHWNSRADA